jgi:hypothetical protein
MALRSGEIFFLEIGRIGYKKMRILGWFQKCKNTLVTKLKNKK